MLFLVILSSLFVVVRTVQNHQTGFTTIFTTNRLPWNGSVLDYRMMPYVGNGHVATVVFSDFIYMNGLYNGDNGTSHRARIPSTLNWQFLFHPSTSSFSLNVSSGRKIVLPTRINEQVTSDDIDFVVAARNEQYVLLSGKTRQVENNQFQLEQLPVFVYYTPLPVNGFELDPQETSRTYLFVTSIDSEQERAKRSFEYASNERHSDQIWSSHVSLWNDVWSNGRVEIVGDDELQRQINSAFYYILSSLPPLSTRSEHKQFYGLSPGSLSRGGLVGEDYAGHSFWDTETWIYPSILLFYPNLAKEMLSYRIALRDSAADNARLFGYEGWRYPWESARTGVDVTPDGYLDIATYQQHITGDISFAARQYIAATGDRKWLMSEYGGDLVYETARFWASRVVYSNEKKKYEILSKFLSDLNTFSHRIYTAVLPPDEDARPFKNNSVFTNAVASYSIQLAHRVSCITKKVVPQHWLDIAFNLYFPFDNATQTHLEYDGFDLKNTIIKQADAVLLGFPLMWPMNKEVRRNDLLFYEPLTRASGPAMTWSMHTIGFLELNDLDKAQQFFRRAYETYVQPPYNIWTEIPESLGAVNFITGAGGFLQAVIFGYGGIRLTLDQLEVMPPPRLPNQAEKLIFHGLKYHGSILDLTIDNQNYHIDVRGMDNNNSMSLVYEYEQEYFPLTNNIRLSYPINTRLVIRPLMHFCA
ncbi:unnamed protein product [Rotaria magnacalcarata]|uniref:Protein-glucosylgalactosylhydroxylysine glucosidase n=2 Tax=Rotaria magnacalcarata TaxID=392030 RepID=A0A815YV27_9BILA|nr:unnamed protein product [Rotaria magnacalcarata]CAF1574619.1 unnamed protein product [Rotaria magnacalcarata]CAF2116700.1 unnamed protein product [Rotaria magnacalcarata]